MKRIRAYFLWKLHRKSSTGKNK